MPFLSRLSGPTTIILSLHEASPPSTPTAKPDLKERLIGGLLLASLIHVWLFGVIVVPLATYKMLAQVGGAGGRGIVEGVNSRVLPGSS